MAQTVDLLVKVQDAEAKVKLDKITNDIRKAQQLAKEGITITSSSVKEDANGLVTAITKYIDAEKRLITLKQQEYVVQEEIRGEEGKITQERQTAIRDTKTISTNYAQIAKELSRMEAESTKITAETERLAQNAERAKAAFAKSLTGKTRENYQNGGYSAEFASEVQSATTVAWQQYSASLTEAYQKQSQLNAETSMFGQISDSAFAQYSSGAMSAAVAQNDVNTAQEQSVESIAHGIVTAQKFFDTMNGVGQSCGITAKEVSVFGELSDDAFHKYSTGAMSADEANKSVEKSTDRAGESAQRATKQFTLLHTIFLRLAHTAITAVTRSFREALTEMKNVDSELVVVRKVSDATAEQLSALKDRAYEVGAAYGVAASDYLSAAAEMTRAGYREQAGDLAELATKLQLVGDVSQDVANQFLIATDKSYKMNGNYQKLSETIDKLNEIDNNFATSFEKVADGIGLLAPVAAQANVSFDEMAAAIGTVTAVTQRSGTESARALRSLFLNIIKDTNTEIEDGVTWTIEEVNSLSDALKKYAPEVVKAAEATGELINPMEAVGALSQSYKEGLLTNKDLFDIVSGLGGKLRTSQLLALIQNWDMYNEMLEKTETAAGSADKEVQNALNSWQVKLNQLKNTFTEFVQKSFSSDFFKGMIDAIKWLIEGFGSLGTVIGLVGGALLALGIPKFITLFTNFGKAITIAGGGLKGFVLTLVNYKTASRAGAVGTEAFSTALKGASLSASIAKIAIVGVVAAIGILIVATNKAKQAEEARINASIEASKKAINEINEIRSLKEEYDELKEKFENGTATREEYESAQERIIEKLKEEGEWAGTTKGDYDDLTESIEKNTAAALKNKEVVLYAGLSDARKKFTRGLNDVPAGGARYDLAEAMELVGSGMSEELLWSQEAEQRIYNFIQAYDKMVAKREYLYENGITDGREFKKLSEGIKTLEPLVKEIRDSYFEYFDLLDFSEVEDLKSDGDFFWIRMVDDYFETERYKGNIHYVAEELDETSESVEETSYSFNGLADSIKKATTALEKYKEKLKDGEKGDTLKSYAEVYKTAAEMYEKGLTGSNAYTAAIDLLIPEDLLRTLGYDYEKAGQYLGSEFYKALFEGGGKDYGANAANYIKENLDLFDGVEIQEASDGTFSVLVTDMEAFAKSAKISEDAMWALMDALDIFNSDKLYTFEDLEQFFSKYSEFVTDFGNGKKSLNAMELIKKLVEDGTSLREIKNIITSLQELANSDSSFSLESLPENLDDAIKKFQEINSESEKYDGIDFVLTSNSEEFFDGISREIKTLDGTTINIGLKWKIIDEPVPLGDGYASGTKSARGGLSLVNEEGAEIIYANGRAWIAGGGNPTLTNIPSGAGVFNAEDTRAILARSGIPSFDGGSAGGIPTQTEEDKPKTKSSSKSLKKILEELSDYIDKILKKAKEALQEQLDAIDEQIDKLKREHDATEEADKLEELRLKILEAEKRLAEAQQERTVRYFNKETGQWEWMADQKAVAEAQKALEDAQKAYDDEVAEQEYQAQLQALQDQKDALNAAYDELSDRWNKILEALQEAENGSGTTDVAKLLASLGKIAGSTTSSDIKKILEELAQFTSNPTSVLDSETASRILSVSNGIGGASSVLNALTGNAAYDLNTKGQSTLGGNTSIVGDTIYYINGVQIGSDMMNKPLSQILSVLPIYAN